METDHDKLMQKDHEKMKQMMQEELASFFNPDQPEGKRFLDVTKIPRICEDLRTIARDVSFLKKIIFGVIAVVFVAWVNSLFHVL